MKKLLVITDPGLDPDDLLNAWLLCELRQLGLVEVLGMVANYDPAICRAMLLKGALKSIGHGDIPVGYGTKCNAKHTPREYEFHPSFELASMMEIMSGYRLIEKVIGEAEPYSITLLLTSGLTDAYEFLACASDKEIGKIKDVYIMGGASYADGRIIADPTASNNKFDKTLDPQWVYDLITQRRIPLHVLSRHAAYACGITPQFYEQLAHLNPIASHLYRVQKEATYSLWQFANSNPPEHRQNREWFCKTFCGVEDIPLPAEENPWEYVKKLAIYDPLTTMWMAFPHMPQFQPELCVVYDEQEGPLVSGVNCEILGLSAEQTGIKDGTSILTKMTKILRGGNNA